MKKIKLLLTLSLIVIMSGISIAQELHNAKVLGIVNLSSQDFATIIDLTANDVYKTALYGQELLIIDEDIQLSFTSGSVQVVKAGLTENIFAFQEEQTNLATNPYEMVGINHNILLDVIGYDQGFPSLNFEDMYNIIQVETNNSIEITSDELETLLKPILSDNFSDIEYTVDNLLKEGNTLNERDVEVLTELLTNIKGSENYDDVMNKISTIENSISADVTLSEEGKTMLFIATSIARHSSTYWEEASLSSSHPWGDLMDNDYVPTKFRWWRMTLADLWGGLTGEDPWNDGAATQSSARYFFNH